MESVCCRRSPDAQDGVAGVCVTEKRGDHVTTRPTEAGDTDNA